MNRRAFALAGVGLLATSRVVAAQTGTPVGGVADGPALFGVNLEGAVLPEADVIVGVVLTSMTAGTQVVYPEDGSPESLVVDHVLSGGYTFRSDSETRVLRADGSVEEFSAGDEVSVSAGETLVLIDNELEATFEVGDEDTETVTIGLFTLGQGSNDSTIDGELDVAFVGASPPLALPDDGVQMVVVDLEDAPDSFSGALAQLSFETESSGAFEMVLLPYDATATPVAGTTL